MNEFLPCDFVISGPVWEYFSNDPDSTEIYGLKKELRLDLENGFFGKTIIHPSQINVVNQEYIVDYHDYTDAKDVLSREGGVSKGNHRMNEAATLILFKMQCVSDLLKQRLELEWQLLIN